MTREEQIKLASVENADKRLSKIEELDFAISAKADFDNGLTIGFIDGAKWADKTMIDKACEWLDRQCGNPKYWNSYGGFYLETLLADLRKAMNDE